MLTFRPAPALKDLERVGFLSWIIEAVGFGFVRWRVQGGRAVVQSINLEIPLMSNLGWFGLREFSFLLS